MDGQWQDTASCNTLNVENPSNSEENGTIPACGAVETNAAIAAAETAVMSFRKTTLTEQGSDTASLRGLVPTIRNESDSDKNREKQQRPYGTN